MKMAKLGELGVGILYFIIVFGVMLFLKAPAWACTSTALLASIIILK